MSRHAMDLPEPTGDQCEANAIIEHDGVRYLATWYPQMGGYGGKCLVQINDGKFNQCFECYVWHDGDFPFGGDSQISPARLHHCDPEQFIRFGELVAESQCADMPRKVGLGVATVNDVLQFWLDGECLGFREDLAPGEYRITATRVEE